MKIHVWTSFFTYFFKWIHLKMMHAMNNDDELWSADEAILLWMCSALHCDFPRELFLIAGDCFRNTHELLNLRALKFSSLNEIHIFLCAACWAHFMCHHELWPISRRKILPGDTCSKKMCCSRLLLFYIVLSILFLLTFCLGFYSNMWIYSWPAN